MGVLHFIQFALMMVLSNDFSLPVTSSYLEFNPATQSLGLTNYTIADIMLGPLVALFLLISSVAHFSLASPWGYPWYVRNLKKHINYARWYEYALSSSVMIVVIAMLVGVYDVGTLIPLFAINACMNLFGLMMELHNQTTEKTNWTAYFFGVFAGVIPWVVIAIYLVGASVAAAGRIPDFVYWIFVSIAFFFNIFAVNMILQYKQVGRWKDYLYGERMYVILSLVAKSALAWQVFAGTLTPV
ncbi:hypothetical protein GWO13_00700 [Candidatus Bathyarchaeota archaeon]|nr:hypothetical protein [Candidatus Bathyarchaeota archaeon]